MKIVVSGAHGFIGSNLIKMLGDKYDFVELERDDFYNEELVRSLFKDADVFVHLAGISSISECEKDLEKAFQVNVGLAGYLVELFYRIRPKGRVIFSSTGQVYDESAPAPYTEESAVAPSNAYSMTKLAAENVLRVIAETHHANLTILRLFNTSHKSQNVRFFLPSVYQQLEQSPEKKVTVNVGNIDIERDFSSIQDVIYSFDFIFQQKSSIDGVDLYNICSGTPKKLRDMIIALSRYLGKDVDFHHELSKLRQGESQIHYGKSKLTDLLPHSYKSKEINDFIESFISDI